MTGNCHFCEIEPKPKVGDLMVFHEYNFTCDNCFASYKLENLQAKYICDVEDRGEIAHSLDVIPVKCPNCGGTIIRIYVRHLAYYGIPVGDI